jgi:hypothetical protein
LIDRSVGKFLFSQAFALHRPTNGATAIIPKEIPNAMCISTFSFRPEVLKIL